MKATQTGLKALIAVLYLSAAVFLPNTPEAEGTIGGQSIPRIAAPATGIGGTSAPKTGTAVAEIGGQNQQKPKDIQPIGLKWTKP